MTDQTIAAQIEAAFREGYREGYSNGASDANRYEWGGGSKHDNTLRREQDQAWGSSDTFTALTPVHTS